MQGTSRGCDVKKSRYDEPADAPPDPCRLGEYIRDAEPTIKDYTLTADELRHYGLFPWNPILTAALLRDARQCMPWLVIVFLRLKEAQEQRAAEVEARRVAAVRKIHALYRRWEINRADLFAEMLARRLEEHIRNLPEKKRDEAIHNPPATEVIDREFCVSLQEAVDRLTRMALASPNPPSALAELFGDRPRKRGRQHADTRFRDHVITVDVEGLIRAGHSAVDAYRMVADRPGHNIDLKMIESIHLRLRNSLAVRAELGLAEAARPLNKSPI
jgi:hypothetical protein